MSSSRTLFINSKDRTSGNQNSYIVDTTGLTDSFFQLKDDELLLVKPQSFAVLNDYDNINIYNRTFQILLENFETETTTTYNVNLTPGVYNSFTLQTELQNEINAVLTANGLPVTLVITFDDDTLKYTYTFTADTGDYFDKNEIRFSFDSADTSPAQLMGFTDGEFIPALAGSTAIITSSEAVDMVFQPQIQVHCSLVSSNYETSSIGTKGSDLLFTIYSQTKNSWIHYENQSNSYETESVKQFGSIEIRYTDNLGRPILFQSNSRLALSFTKVKMSNEEPQNKIIEVLNEILDVEKLTALGISLSSRA